MTFKCKYKTPAGFGNMWMNSDGEALTGLWFEGSRDQSKHKLDCEERELPIFRETRRWLDIYFAGRQPDFTPPYRIDGLTPSSWWYYADMVLASDLHAALPEQAAELETEFCAAYCVDPQMVMPSGNSFTSFEATIKRRHYDMF